MTRYWRLVGLAVGLMAVVLIPFFIWEDQLAALAARWLDEGRSRAALAVAVAGLLAADVLLPVPSSMVSTASGYLLGFWQGMAASWIGMTLACLIGYGIGRFAQPLARRIVGAEDLKRFSHASSGYLVLAGSRAVPVLAEASVIVCGMAARPLWRFLWVCGLANLGISIAYAAIGAWALHTQSFLLAFVGALVVPWIAIRLFGKKR